MTADEIFNLFNYAKANYTYIYKIPAIEIEAILGVWKLELKEVSFEDAFTSLRKYCFGDNVTFPSPVAILKGIDGGTTYKVQEALEKFRKAIKWSCSVIFDDPYIHKTVKLMGGWINITSQQEEQKKWIEKEFTEIYENVISKKTDCSDIDKVLYVRRDINNIEHGFSVMEPVKIGDIIKINQWHNKLDERIKKHVMIDGKAS